MAAYLYECRYRGSCYRAPFFYDYLRITASVEPDAMPGKTNFVAGFIQCELYRRSPTQDFKVLTKHVI